MGNQLTEMTVNYTVFNQVFHRQYKSKCIDYSSEITFD